MAIVADSSTVYGLYDKRDASHASLRAVVETERDVLVPPALTLGEIDYLLRVRLGNAALLRFLADIQEGAFVVEAVTLADLRRCAALMSKYHDLDLNRVGRHQGSAVPQGWQADKFGGIRSRRHLI